MHKSIMHDKIFTMLQLQDDINRKVNENWTAQGNAWYRAIWIECAELMDHHGWKWWKKQTPDLEQIRLELVDIWHFGLSILLERHGLNDSTAASVAAQIARPVPCAELLTGIEAFAANTLATRDFSVPMFAGLLQKISFSFDEVFKTYVGKNVLNMFRQDNGYKEGSYIKVWNGREDNEHLAEIASALDGDDAQFKNNLYQQLQQRYDVAAR